jgi:hypothetical protein
LWHLGTYQHSRQQQQQQQWLHLLGVMRAVEECQVLVGCRPAYLLQQKQQLTVMSLTQLWFSVSAVDLGFDLTLI